MNSIICVNGRYVTKEKAVVSVKDMGMLYGYGLFETVKVHKGKPLFWDKHLRRLKESCVAVNINLPFAAADISEMVLKTINENKVKDGSLRVTVTAGEDMKDKVSGGVTGSANIVVMVRHGIPYSEDQYERGFTACVAGVKRNESSVLVRLKTLNYLENFLAREKARSQGFDESIFLNTKGCVAEGSATNIFIISREKLLTPDINSGILPGIVRKVILELAADIGLPSEEKPITYEELLSADECFLTNSLMGVMPLVQVDKKLIGKGKPGPFSLKLMDLYKNIITQLSQHENQSYLRRKAR